jgi:diguanylate cyclase (GGDEF)-like protein
MSSSDRSQRPLHVAPVADDAGNDRVAAARERRLAEADRRKAAAFLWSTYRDKLTGALQRDPGRHQLQAAISRAHLTSAPLSLVFFDVDNLKAVNDREGHPRGDEMLAAAGRALHLSLRKDDVIVRYGGDEFVCALLAVDHAEVSAAIGRVGRTFDSLIPGATVSAGCAHLIAGDTLDDLIRRADADLYGRRRRRRASGSHGRSQPASVACGACGGRISLQEFVVVGGSRVTRTADCPACGEVTLIRLA